MTYHHLRHREDGGKANIENGASINALAHCYLHSLPREQEEIVNNMLRDFKDSIQCKVELVDDLEFPYTIIATEIVPAELFEKKQKYNRAKEKAAWKKKAEEELEE